MGGQRARDGGPPRLKTQSSVDESNRTTLPTHVCFSALQNYTLTQSSLTLYFFPCFFSLATRAASVLASRFARHSAGTSKLPPHTPTRTRLARFSASR